MSILYGGRDSNSQKKTLILLIFTTFISMELIIPIIIILGAILLIRYFNQKEQWKYPEEDFPKAWRIILVENVNFYNALNGEEKARFEKRIQEFLLNYRITGIKTNVSDEDKVLIASSGIMPIFKFPKWRYSNLSEILLYSATFNDDYETKGKGRNILGMVGNGPMEGIMILSKPALHLGFDNDSDKKNTALHEFIHLIDKMDGSIDGIPSLLIERPYVLPWLDLIKKKIDEIYEGKSDLNPYGATNEIEFFAVASEYFFERPKLMADKHPKLYAMLEDIFDHDMDERALSKPKNKIGRNSPCPCDSGEKFKKCCGAQHFA